MTKTATANGLSGQEAKQLATIDEYLEEIAFIRKRIKPTDTRIRRADVMIRQRLDEAWATLRHVQANH